MPFGARGGSSTPLPSFTPPRQTGHVAAISSGAVAEKIALSRHSRTDGWLRRNLRAVFVPLRIGSASKALFVPVLRPLHPAVRSQTPRPIGGVYSLASVILALVGTAIFWLLLFIVAIVVLRPWLPARKSLPFMDQSTLVVSHEHIGRIWQWEIASGHYPSRKTIDFAFPTLASHVIENPAVPSWTDEEAKRERHSDGEERLGAARQPAGRLRSPKVVPIGYSRYYIEIPPRQIFDFARYSSAPSPYPRRPVFGSSLDMDLIMDHCDFGTGKYVRDCLEILRTNAGLDQGVRRGDLSSWRIAFVTKIDRSVRNGQPDLGSLDVGTADMSLLLNSSSFANSVSTRQATTLAHAAQRRKHAHSSHPTADPDCDPDYPRILHMFWAGPFTDKPYVAALSFLYTQNLNLHKPPLSDRPFGICRPQLWIWINPGPASSFPDPTAVFRMRSDLKNNPWSAPLLHPRFKDVIKFKLWNTTEQLDAIPEMKGWRNMRLFNSGGVKYGKAPAKDDMLNTIELSDTADDKVAEAAAREDAPSSTNMTANATIIAGPLPSKAKDELFRRVGSTSAKGYDRLSVVLSDLARFALTHRFGGVYLDADTLLLRDWEELWGSSFSFVYRWSRLDKLNSAIMKMHRNSALGNFIFRTAVANGLDFHPMTISKYLKDANLESLMLRLPDALFDPAWLNTEYYQRDRPPQPYLKRFEDFFDTPQDQGAAPNALGFDGFFRGAFCHHWHNFWWKAFDPARNFPDLGSRFQHGERLARGRLLAAKLAAQSASDAGTEDDSMQNPNSNRQANSRSGRTWGQDERDFDDLDWSDETVGEDERDLSWSAVIKRTFESYLRGERPNMYGEWLNWGSASDEYLDDFNGDLE